MLRLPSQLGPLTCGTASLVRSGPQGLLGTSALVTPASMYAARYYNSSGGGKPGRRAGLVGGGLPVLDNHHHTLPHPQNFQPAVYQGRLDGLRAHYQNHHHYHSHAHPLPLHHHPHHSKKKTWNFIHEKMSYDTFFTMKRLIDRSRSVDEVLRWVTQNPGKISYNHYPIALQKIGQLLQQQQQTTAMATGGGGGALAPPSGTAVGESHYRQISEHQDFQTLCDAIVSDCAKFDNFSIVNCLYAVAALGLPSDSQIVQVLEEESRGRLSQFNQKDISMVFSSSMKLHPSSQHPLIESCLSGLEKNIERERHPQTLFLLLSYYRLKWRALQADGYTPEQLLANRKILRLVKHTLASVSSVRDHEMALLDEMLSACAREASNKSLELIFSSHLFYQNRQEKFVSSLAEELPKKVESITPYTMALIAKYIARHRLRETKLLDTIAEFLVKKGEYLDSKVQPVEHIFLSFFSYKGLVAEALRQLLGEQSYKQDEVLAPGYYTDFLLWIDSTGSVLPIKSGGGGAVSMGTSCTPTVSVAPKPPEGQSSVATLTSDFQKFSPFSPLEDGTEKRGAEDLVSTEAAFLSHRMRPQPPPAPAAQRGGPNGGNPLDYNPYYPTSDYYASLAKEQSLESQDSSTLSSPSDCLAQAGAPGAGGTGGTECSSVLSSTSLFQFPIGKILDDEGTVGGVAPGPDCDLPTFYEGVSYPEGGEGAVVPSSPLQLHGRQEAERGSGDPHPHQFKRVIMSVNDKWHYCHNSDVLVGSRAMRDRHLQLLGYIILQLPYHELEKLNGIEEVKQYLHKKLLEVPL
nr:PREDICTED: fas-activated serine/threonine kinase-like [Lepisosteus oculatus]